MDLIEELMSERDKLMPKFSQWEQLNFNRNDSWSVKLPVYEALASLIDFPQSYMAVLGANEDPKRYRMCLERLRMLNGPNGYTVYRMMKLQKNSLQE